MLEGKALVVAIMMLTAAPIAATDSGQIFIEDVRNNVEKMLSNEEPAKVTEIIDDSDRSAEEDTDVPCFTFEEWKERYSDEEKVDEVKAVESKENKNDRARGDDDRKEDDKKEDYYDKEDWADKETVSKYDDCLTDDEWTLKFESDKDESCFTFEDFEAKKWDETKYHNKGWDRIHYEERSLPSEDNDWDEDEEFRLYLEELSNACDEGEDEACEELLAIREELAEDREEEREDEERNEKDDEHNHVDDEADDHSHDDDEADDHNHVTDRYDENWDKDWHNEGERDWNEDSCLTMEEWKKIFADDKKEGYDEHDWDDEKICIREDENGVIHYDCGDDRKEKGPHRDAFVRVMLEELEYACEEENDEEACAELEEIVAEFEEREGECNKERDDEEENDGDESDEDDEWDENDEDESDDGDDSDEDNSEE